MPAFLLGTKLAAAAASGALGVSGLTAAAYTGSLPEQAQAVAHAAIGAPAPQDASLEEEPLEEELETDVVLPEPAKTAAVGPDAAGAAAYGLCTAYANSAAHGSSAEKSVAIRNLALAAGGEDGITAYCDAVEHPSAKATARPTRQAAPAPQGRPTDRPRAATAPRQQRVERPAQSQGQSRGKAAQASQGKRDAAGGARR
jgi:hypothetical protein